MNYDYANITGLNTLESIGGNLFINFNSAVTSIDAFANLPAILVLGFLPVLTSLENFGRYWIKFIPLCLHKFF